jgi:hypothetical protein
MSTYQVITADKMLLPGGLMVDAQEIRKSLARICHYVQDVLVCTRNGKDPFAVIFPNRKLYGQPDYEKSPEEGCFCPRNLPELGKCLSGCTETMNRQLPEGTAPIAAAVIINEELTRESGTRDANGLPVYAEILDRYRNHFENLFGGNLSVKEDAFNIKL